MIEAEGAVIEAEGTVIEAEGAVIEAEGAVIETEGAVIEAEGAVIEAEGAVIEAEGAVIEADRKADIGSLVSMQQSQDNGVAVKLMDMPGIVKLWITVRVLIFIGQCLGLSMQYRNVTIRRHLKNRK